MKQTIVIEVPDGKKAVWKDGKVVFEDIKPQLPKTWDEFCEQNNIKKSEYYLDTSSCIIVIADGKRCSSSDRNLLPSKEAAEAHLALMQLHQLRDVWREGWLPDWTDSVQTKYAIYNLAGMFTIGLYTETRQFLAFQDKERAEVFKNCFIDLIRKVGDLI